MAAENYFVIPDTCILDFKSFTEIERMFGRILDSFTESISKNKKIKNVFIAVPQTVIDERVKHKLEEIEILKQTYVSLKKVNPEIDLDKLTKFDYKTEFEKIAKDFVNKKKIEIIPLPSNITFTEIYTRAIEKIAPFSSGGKEFKDTTIWLSIKEFSQKFKNSKFILITSNISDFPQDTLSKELNNGNNLAVIKDLFDIPPIIEKEFDKDEEMLKEQKEIELKIKRRIGDILLDINKKRFFYGYGDKIKITCLKLKDIEFQGIFTGNPAYISLRLFLEPVFEEKPSGNQSWLTPIENSLLTGSSYTLPTYNTNSYYTEMPHLSYNPYEHETAIIDVNIEYYSNGEIKINDTNPSYPLEMDIMTYQQ